jgi:hypothetical protein
VRRNIKTGVLPKYQGTTNNLSENPLEELAAYRESIQGMTSTTMRYQGINKRYSFSDQYVCLTTK